MTASKQARADCDYCDNGRFCPLGESSYECGYCGRDVLSSSDQARADARADAETLWLVAGPDRTMEHDLILARVCGAHAGGLAASDEGRYRFAIIAARAAFRAVPGLRGDR